MDSIFEQVEKNIDSLVRNSVDWTASATKEELEAARNGELHLRFGNREVPEEWLRDLEGIRVLCLAGAGGLQAPLFACAGAEVTVLDLSEGMLEKDRQIAEEEKLPVEIIKGNMCDLSRFEDGTFDLIFNPPSLMYVPDVSTVFRECYRVLTAGGELITIAPAPIQYTCDRVEDGQGGYYKAVNRMPWCSRDEDDSGWIEYGHTMEEYLNGMIRSGFVLNGYLESQGEDLTDLWFIARTVKPEYNGGN